MWGILLPYLPSLLLPYATITIISVTTTATATSTATSPSTVTAASATVPAAAAVATTAAVVTAAIVVDIAATVDATAAEAAAAAAMFVLIISCFSYAKLFVCPTFLNINNKRYFQMKIPLVFDVILVKTNYSEPDIDIYNQS